LRAAFAEVGAAGFDQRGRDLDTYGLGHRDQRDGIGRTPASSGCGGNPPAHARQVVGDPMSDIVHERKAKKLIATEHTEDTEKCGRESTQRFSRLFY
jgi:hypothetical protein